MHSISFKGNDGTHSTVFFDENAFEFFTPRLSIEETHRLMRDLAAQITFEDPNACLYIRYLLQYQEQEKIQFDVYYHSNMVFGKKTFSISERARERQPLADKPNANDVPVGIKELPQQEYIKNYSAEVQKRAATLLEEGKLLSNASFPAPAAPIFSTIQKDIDALWIASPETAKQELRSVFGERFEATISVAERDRDRLLAQLKEKQFARLAALEQQIAAMQEGAPDTYSRTLEAFVAHQLEQYKLLELVAIVKSHLQSEKSRLEKFSAPTAFTELLAYYIMFKRTHLIITHVNQLLCWAIYSQAQLYFDSIKHDKEKRAEYNRHFAPFGLAANDCGQLPTLAAMYETKFEGNTLQTASLAQLQTLLRAVMHAISKTPSAAIITKGLAEFEKKIVEDHRSIYGDTPKVTETIKSEEAKAADNPSLMGRLVSASIYIGKATVGAATSSVLNYFNINYYLEKFSQSFRSAPVGATLFYEANPFSWKENLTSYVESNAKAKTDIINYVCQHDEDLNLKSQVDAKLTNPLTQEKLVEMDCLMDIIESRLTKNPAPRPKRGGGKSVQANIANPKTTETLEEKLTKAYDVLPQPPVSLIMQAENARTMLVESDSARQLVDAMDNNLKTYTECTSTFLTLTKQGEYGKLTGKPRDYFSQFSGEIEREHKSMSQEFQRSNAAYQEMHAFCSRLAGTNAPAVNAKISDNKEEVRKANIHIEAQRLRAEFALRALRCFIAEQKQGMQMAQLDQEITTAETLIKQSAFGLDALQHDVVPLINQMRVNLSSLRSADAFNLAQLIEHLNASSTNIPLIQSILSTRESTQAKQEIKKKNSACLFDLVKMHLKVKQLQVEKKKVNEELSQIRRQASTCNLLSHNFLQDNIDNTDNLEAEANKSAIDLENCLTDLSKNTLSEINLDDFNNQLANCAAQLKVTTTKLETVANAKNLICQSMVDVRTRSPSPPSQPNLHIPNPYANDGIVMLCNEIVSIITNLNYWQSKTKFSSLPFFGGKPLDGHVVPKHIRLLNRCIKEYGRHNSPEMAEGLLLKLNTVANIALQNPTKKGRRTATKHFYPLLQRLTTQAAVKNAQANRGWETDLEKWKTENDYLKYQPVSSEKAEPRLRPI